MKLLLDIGHVDLGRCPVWKEFRLHCATFQQSVETAFERSPLMREEVGRRGGRAPQGQKDQRRYRQELLGGKA